MNRYLLALSVVLVCTTATLHADSITPRQSQNNSDVAGVEDFDAAELRERGPRALAMLLGHRDQLLEQIQQVQSADLAQQLRGRLAKLDAIIDEVGGQRYCTASGLYWYTEIEKAKAVAAETGKPILSLRMMGKLTDELSCANSRFFRTTLYANKQVSQYLRESFVLHWKSVRPVPKVTIDFGDGRKLVRTLTGNSAHYVLTPDGKPLDVLPGLYGPAKFLALLSEAETAAAELMRSTAGQPADQADQARAALLNDYHSRRIRTILDAWEGDLRRAKLDTKTSELAVDGDQRVFDVPPAEAAAVIALPKFDLEMNIIRSVTMRAPRLEKGTDEAMWKAIAALHFDDAQLDAASVALIRRQHGGRALLASRLAITKAKVEDPVLRMLAGYQSSVALDTVRNEYLLHRKIHEWFVRGEAADDVDRLNERVYAQLFLTPSSDPWIGLVDGDTYTALENGGIEVNQ